jgi:tyrosine-protein phosphatase YwqE
MLEENCVHFIATDGQGSMARRPLMQRAFVRVAELVGQETAERICCHHPAMVAQGRTFRADPPRQPKPQLARWFHWRKAG